MASADRIPPQDRRRKRLADWGFYGLIAACAVAVLADLSYDKYGHYEIEKIVGAHGIYAVLACVALVLGAGVVRKLLRRDADYYGRNADDDRA